MRTIKIKRGFTEPQTLLDGELGYNIGSKTLYIGNGGGKDLLFVGGSVYPKTQIATTIKKPIKTRPRLEVVNERINNLVPTTIHSITMMKYLITMFISPAIIRKCLCTVLGLRLCPGVR